MAASASIPVKQLDDITECPICTEVYTDPRVLPCIHTYCLKCIEGYWKDKKPGDKVPCPLCRKEFTIPDKGLAELPRNLFVDRLLDVKKVCTLSQTKAVPCDICCHDEMAETEVKQATMYCVECQQKYCSTCSSYHGKMKSSSDHKQIKLGSETLVTDLMRKLPVSTCEKHIKEELKVYCMQCQTAVCVVCYIKQHSSHKCSDIDEVYDELLKQIGSDIDIVGKGIAGCEEAIQKVSDESIEFIAEARKCEAEICAAADKLKALVDRHKLKLIEELNAAKEKRLKQNETTKQEIEFHLAALQSFKRYSEELKNKGTACDVTRAASDLHQRAKELMSFDVTDRAASYSVAVKVSFTASSFLASGDSTNLVGEVQVELSGAHVTKKPATDATLLPSAPVLKHVIPKGAYVSGVTLLGEELFVLRSEAQQLEVYDTTIFAIRRYLSLPDASCELYGLASCTSNMCLYVSNYTKNVVYRISMSSGNSVNSWAVAERPTGLSVNSARNVIVASCSDSTIREYTTNGVLVRGLSLSQYGIKQPWFALQLASGNFLLSHQGNEVCLIGVNGSVERRQSSVKWPVGIVVDKHGSILVADRHNNRILVLDQSLSRASTLSLQVNGGINNPWALYLDESRDRLYIGEFDGGRVLVFDGVKNIAVTAGL